MMKIDWDPGYIRTCMHLWRDALDLQMRMHDEFKLHFIEQRPVILQRYLETASAWQMMLNHMVASPDEQEALAAVVADVKTFHSWAQAELSKIEVLAGQASLEAGIDAALLDPEIGPAIRELARRIRPMPRKDQKG